MTTTPTLAEILARIPQSDRSSHELVAQLTGASLSPRPIHNDHGDLLGYAFTTAKHGHQWMPLTPDSIAQRPPERINAARVFHRPHSFVDYLAEHAPEPPDDSPLMLPRTARIYGDASRATFLAVIDDHHLKAPSHCTHTATLRLAPTPEWSAWANNDGQLLDQVRFAEFIEDHLDQLVEPSAADMLEIAQHLEATRNVQHRSGTRLTSGRIQFVLDETLDARTRNAAGQSIEIPETFVIGARIYEGTSPYRVTCRLRYRINNEGKLTLGYKIQARETLVETATDEIAAQVAEATNLPVWWGTP